MMSMRSVARSAPRTLSRLSARASPARTVVARPLLRSAIAARPLASSPFQTASAAFSTSALRREPAGEVDAQLAEKLSAELEFEDGVEKDTAQPSSIRDFLDNSPFELKDTPGQERVQLTREFGNEKITVTFSISDLTNYDPEAFDEDPALADEDDVEPKPKRSASSEGEAAAEGEEGFEEEEESAVPCRLSIVIEKPNQGAISVEATAEAGQISVDNMYFFADAALAHAASAEVAHKVRDLYPGPPFGTLDEDLQILMERYLEERGITTELAVFVPDYMDSKEQAEYQAWLKNVKSFVEA